jgi:hypothetical protein
MLFQLDEFSNPTLQGNHSTEPDCSLISNKVDLAKTATNQP